MNINKISGGNKFLLIIALIIIILLALNIFLYKTEHFDNQSNLGISFQTGLSAITPTGTITFSTPFSKPPMIFTQIIGSTDVASNVYSIQIFNVTNTGFNYAKNKIASVPSSEYDVIHILQSTLEPFSWVAFG